MPTYEYRCEECGHRFERFQRMSEDPVRTCPSCGGPVRRLIGAGGAVIFGGSAGMAGERAGNRPSCGRAQPCCGRGTPCERRPCD